MNLVTTARRVRPYFQAHTIEVLTDQPMKQVLHKPESLGRLVKWAIELSEFDIRYKPRAAIKGQILVDFIAEFTLEAPMEATQLIPDLPMWKMKMLTTYSEKSTREYEITISELELWQKKH